MLRNQKARVKLTCPVLPERVLANLQHAIEQMDETDAKAVAALLKCYQIQNSRLAGALSYFNDPNRFGREKIMTERNIEHTFDETVKLSLLIDNMFSFARDDVAHISPAKFSRTQVANNLSVLELQNLISDECRSHLMRTLATENGYGSKSRNSA